MWNGHKTLAALASSLLSNACAAHELRSKPKAMQSSSEVELHAQLRAQDSRLVQQWPAQPGSRHQGQKGLLYT